MRISRTLVVAFRDLIHHAFRSLLTALGVVFGVGAVVAMMAISEGARLKSLASIESLGIDTIVVRSVQPSVSETPEGSIGSILEYGLTNVDVRHVSVHFENILAAAPVRDTRQPVYAEGQRLDARVFGVTPIFLSLTKSRLFDSRSRWLTKHDNETRSAVCVLGKRAARRLFLYEDPMGKSVTFGGASFTVVGLLDNPYESTVLGGYNLNDQIYVPLATGNAVFGNVVIEQSAGSRVSTKVEADYLFVQVRELEYIEETSARLRSWLKKTHSRSDYEVQVPYELLKQKEASQAIFTVVMASIAGISLLVGGIGIMNIMLANVYERTKEIGTRRALGAKKKDILVQFLAEAVLLTGLGGLIGVAVGYGIAEAVSHYADWQTAVTTISVVLSLGVAVFTGVLFGTYPAWKAANLDPILALRSE